MVYFVGPHSNALKLLEFAEDIFDQVSAFIDFWVDAEFLRAARMLRDDNLGAATVQLGDDGVGVVSLRWGPPWRGRG